jgi:hypothetical protein
MMLYKIGRSPRVVRCDPKLGLEVRRLRPKVLATCHDGARLQNVFGIWSLSSHSQTAVGWSPQVPSSAGGACSVLYGVYAETWPFLSSCLMQALSGWYPSVTSRHWILCFVFTEGCTGAGYLLNSEHEPVIFGQ